MANDKSAKPAEAPAAVECAKEKLDGQNGRHGGSRPGARNRHGRGNDDVLLRTPRTVADVPLKPAEPEEKDVEVELMKDRLPNNVGGRPFTYDLQIFAKVNEKDKAKATDLFTSRDAETRDRIRTIIASSDPKSLGEPGLETLRRQIAYQLEQDLGKDGKDLVKEVLIPKCTPNPVMQY